MSDSNMTGGEEFTRFYKLTRTGSWHRKSPEGFYEKLKNKNDLKQLQVLAAKPIKHTE